MTPEEYQRIKEAEKAHLRALKQLKQTARILERQHAINRALQDLTGASQAALDTHAEMLDKLTLETAMNEARLELALDAAAERAAQAPAPEALEAELQVARARQLIDEIKQQAAAGSPARQADADALEQREPAQKTLGRRPAPPEEEHPSTPSSAPRELPEKTIGRMR